MKFAIKKSEAVGTSRRSEASEVLVMEPTMEAGVETESGSKPLGAVVQIDEGKIRAHLDGVVRATVEETLNALLDAERGSMSEPRAARTQCWSRSALRRAAIGRSWP